MPYLFLKTDHNGDISTEIWLSETRKMADLHYITLQKPKWKVGCVFLSMY